jgi:hypothetical protein
MVKLRSAGNVRLSSNAKTNLDPPMMTNSFNRRCVVGQDADIDAWAPEYNLSEAYSKQEHCRMIAMHLSMDIFGLGVPFIKIYVT